MVVCRPLSLVSWPFMTLPNSMEMVEKLLKSRFSVCGSKALASELCQMETLLRTPLNSSHPL